MKQGPHTSGAVHHLSMLVLWLVWLGFGNQLMEEEWETISSEDYSFVWMIEEQHGPVGSSEQG